MANYFGFFNRLKNTLFGRKLEKEAKKSRLRTYETPQPLRNLGSYYKKVKEMTK